MEQLTNTIIVSPDAKTSGFLSAAIAGGTDCATFTMGKGIEKKVQAALKNRIHPVLIIVPGAQLNPALLELCRLCVEQKGFTLVWAQPAAHRDDTWLLQKLLENAGATVCASLDILSATAQLFVQTQLHHGPFTSVAIVSPSCAVMHHLADAISEAACANPPTDAPKIRLDKSSGFCIDLAGVSVGMNTSPSVLGAAISLLCNFYRERQYKVADLEIEPDTDTILLIARPPARILSETTSKRLLGAFGLTTPVEALCDSPSKAVRFAKEINGPVTLKLVRPNFLFKSVAGGVIQNVSGPSEIQKAYQTLLTLSEELGGPRALGILVSEQIESDNLFWLDLKRHSQMGKVIYFGLRNEITEAPDGALPLPCTLLECYEAAARSCPNVTSAILERFSEAMFRFGTMCTQLDTQIGLAQIHPLAITQHGPIMLDAVIGLTDAPPKSI